MGMLLAKRMQIAKFVLFLGMVFDIIWCLMLFDDVCEVSDDS